MYRRLTIEEIKTRRSEYHKIPAFMVTYRAIDWVSTTYQDIDPVEAWDEAVETMKTIAAEEYKRFAIETTCRDLPRKYLQFQNVDNTILPREPEDANRTALMVLFNVLFMLIMRQKEQDGHPYLEYCKWIIPVLQQFPQYEAMCNMTRTNEENLEEDVGHELEPADFLNTEGIPMPITERDTTKENMERAIEIFLKCSGHFKRGIGIEYVRGVWEDLLEQDHLHVDELLNGQSFQTLVYGVLGLIKDDLCDPCSNIALAKDITSHQIDQQTIANYIGKKCSGSGALKKVASYLKERHSKSSRKSSDFDF